MQNLNYIEIPKLEYVDMFNTSFSTIMEATSYY